MSLIDRIETDHTAAHKHGDSIIAEGLGMILAVNTVRSKHMLRALTDREVQMIVKGLVLQFDRWLLTAAPEERAKLTRQQTQLRCYLPQPLTDHDLEKIVVRQNSVMNPSEIKVFLKRNYNGRYDPARADQIVREVTSS